MPREDRREFGPRCARTRRLRGCRPWSSSSCCNQSRPGRGFRRALRDRRWPPCGHNIAVPGSIRYAIGTRDQRRQRTGTRRQDGDSGCFSAPSPMPLIVCCQRQSMAMCILIVRCNLVSDVCRSPQCSRESFVRSSSSPYWPPLWASPGDPRCVHRCCRLMGRRLFWGRVRARMPDACRCATTTYPHRTTSR